MDNEEFKTDNILFIVEGKKAEAKYIKAIYEHYYPDQYVVINRENHSSTISSEGQALIDINWIVDANIEKFIDDIELDEYGDGVSIINSFVEKNDVKTYSEAFIIIDADLKDKSSGNNNAKNKIDLITRLLNIVDGNDENVEVLVNSPMLEAVVDINDSYAYIGGESYKSKVNGQFANGAYGKFINETSEVLKMNVMKYDSVDYLEHSSFALKTFDVDTSCIKVRSPLFHIIANKETIYGEVDLLIKFLEKYWLINLTISITFKDKANALFLLCSWGWCYNI